MLLAIANEFTSTIIEFESMLNAHRFFWLPIFFMLLAVLSSCNDERFSARPLAYGDEDEILVIAENALWQGQAGDTFRHFFEALYPITPTPEPIFDIRQEPFEKLNPTLQTRRTLLFLADLSDKESATTGFVRGAIGAKNVQRALKDSSYCTAVQRDRWGRNQLILFVFSKDKESLIRNLDRQHNRIIAAINQEDEKLLRKRVYLHKKHPKAMNLLRDSFGIELEIPGEYYISHQDSNALWLRHQTEKGLSKNIFVYEFPYTPENQVNPESLFKLRNRVSKRYFSTEIEGSYMEIDDRVFPVFYDQKEINGHYAIEARGLWHMVNDFMAGSFISYLILDEANQRVFLVDGFVYYPQEEKRPALRRIDMVLSSFKVLDSNFTKKPVM